ncbi:DNA breaking-rejoining protein [Salmonella enterica]|nr:DNA breaking-rejoining protein [Salmonella enterica]EHZ8201936.1 DNA breaking-rejoining protein [Salmonella enterica]
MADAFDRIVDRMNRLTADRLGGMVQIDGAEYRAVESVFLAEFGVVSAEGVWLVIFSPEYRPTRQQSVVWQGRDFRVAKWHRFNGKYQILLE